EENTTEQIKPNHQSLEPIITQNKAQNVNSPTKLKEQVPNKLTKRSKTNLAVKEKSTYTNKKKRNITQHKTTHNLKKIKIESTVVEAQLSLPTATTSQCIPSNCHQPLKAKSKNVRNSKSVPLEGQH